MPFRWKLFGFLNYILLIGYVLLLGFAAYYAITVPPYPSEIGEVILVILGLLFSVLNYLLNIVIFHKYIPNRPLKEGIKRLHQASTILYFVGLGITVYTLFPSVKEELNEDQEGYFLTGIFIITVLAGAFILFHQFVLRRWLDNNGRNSIEKMIDDIGNKENPGQL